jgi:predicted phosphodiesterase
MNGIPDSPAAGIMADSHGSHESIEAAVSVFSRQGCRTMFHLGDICDSQVPAASGDCIDLLVRHGVQAILGNNDHAIVRSSPDGIRRDTMEYLAALPMEREFQSGLLVHNRPGSTVLGASCLVGDLGLSDLHRFDRDYAAAVLFRGHAHRPSIESVNASAAGIPPIRPGKEYRLDPRWKWVVTCGALENGYCLTWYPAEMVLTIFQL